MNAQKKLDNLITLSTALEVGTRALLRSSREVSPEVDERSYRSTMVLLHKKIMNKVKEQQNAK